MDLELLKASLQKAFEQYVVGIINGPRYNAAYADQEVCGGALCLYICCYEEPRAWEGAPPALSEDGTGTLRYDPKDENPKTDPCSSITPMIR